MKLIIKNIVNIRCEMIVKSVLEALAWPYCSVELGEVQTKENITDEQRERLKTPLLKYGFEPMDDRKAILIEKIKNVVIEMVHYEHDLPKIKNSVYISAKLNYDYTYLSNLFSEVTCSSIEHYIIGHKIEKVKELLLYYVLSLAQISYKLNYSSPAHLSNRVKKITGLTPTTFKKLRNKRLNALGNVGIVEHPAALIKRLRYNQSSSLQKTGKSTKIPQRVGKFILLTATG